MTHEHRKKIMICTHVIIDGEPMGEMEAEIKSDTMICQKCVDKMMMEPFDEYDLPKEVHFACKKCVLQKIQGTIKRVRLIKKKKQDEVSH